MAQRLLVDGYGDELDWSGCDACSWEYPHEFMSHGFGGLTFPMETTQCHRCTSGGTGYDECEVSGRSYPSTVEPYNHYYEKVLNYPSNQLM